MKHALRTWPLLLCSLLLARYAGASVDYPAEVKKFYEIETLPATPPSCTLCHSTDSGGADTVVRPFGRSLIRFGAVKDNIPSLDSALAQIEESGTDSDADGVGDVEELRMGSDPNVGTGETADPLADVPFPETGCSLAARHTSAPVEALALLCAVLLRCARRRR